MYEFMIKRVVNQSDLNSVEGRAHALRAALQVVRTIRDGIVRQGYVRELAGWLGMNPTDVQAELARAPRAPDTAPRSADPPGASPEEVYQLGSLSADPVTAIERDALMVLLQYPDSIPSARAVEVLNAHISHGALALVRDAMVSAFAHYGSANWATMVQEEVPDALRVLAQQMAVYPLPQRSEQTGRYALGVTMTLLDRDLLRTKAELLSRVQRAEPGSSEYQTLQRELVDIETRRRAMREEES